MTIFYYPTLLGFVASTLAYVFNPDLADNGVYTGIVIVVVFWLGVFMSARGGTGGIAKLASSGLLDRHADPGRDPGHPRRRLPAAGQRRRRRRWTPTT